MGPKRMVGHPGVQDQPDDIRDHRQGDRNTEAGSEGHIWPAGVDLKPRSTDHPIPCQKDFLCPFGMSVIVDQYSSVIYAQEMYSRLLWQTVMVLMSLIMDLMYVYCMIIDWMDECTAFSMMVCVHDGVCLGLLSTESERDPLGQWANVLSTSLCHDPPLPVWEDQTEGQHPVYYAHCMP